MAEAATGTFIRERGIRYRAILNRVYPLGIFVVFLLVWQYGLRLAGVPSFILPVPTEIAQSFYTGLTRGLYTVHLWATLEALVIGYIVGGIVGFLLGVAIAEIRVVERVLYPVVTAFQSMPKVAIAPLLVMWFGYGISSKVVIVALLCCFPIMVNTVVGFKSVDADRLDLIRALMGNRLDAVRHVKLPAAAGHIFAGLQMGIVMALIGVIVAEFVGSDHGLGILLQNSMLNVDTPGMFVVLIFLSLIGTLATALVRRAERKVVFWRTDSDDKH